MATVTRKTRLAGIRSITGGVIELAKAADRAEDASYRRMQAGFGETSILGGLAQARGMKRLESAGTWAGAAVVVRGVFTAAAQRTRPSERSTAVPAPVPALAVDGSLTREERLRAVNDLVGGTISLVIAADRSLERRERLTGATIGTSALVGAIGRLRGHQGAVALAGTGYLLALGATVFAAVRRRRA